MIGGSPHLENLSPPYSNQTARYYAHLQCPLCCDIWVKDNVKQRPELSWFAYSSSITYESDQASITPESEQASKTPPPVCAFYAVSLASYLIIVLRLLWLLVCIMQLRAFRSRVLANIALEHANVSSQRASCVQIDDFAPIAHLSDVQVAE
jgi:hypothetical protein